MSRPQLYATGGGKGGGIEAQMWIWGGPDLQRLIRQVTSRTDKQALRQRARKANRDAMGIVVRDARRRAPRGDTPKPAARRLASGTGIRDASTSATAVVSVGNKNMWHGWMVHGGSTETASKFTGTTQYRTKTGQKPRRDIDYPPAQPYLRDAVRATWPAVINNHRKSVEELSEWWDRQRSRPGN